MWSPLLPFFHMNLRRSTQPSNIQTMQRMALPQRSYASKKSIWSTTRREQFATFLILINVLVFLSSFQSSGSQADDPSLTTTETKPPVVRLATGEEFKIGNGGWTTDGTCICGTDSYCMCNPSLAIDLVIADGEDDKYVWLVKRKDTGQYATMVSFFEEKFYLNEKVEFIS